LEMEESIRGVQTCLAPYWGCFNHLEGTPLPEQRWEGPIEAERPPFDIMSPTPPREEAEERDFRQQVSELAAKTCLRKPQFKLAIDPKSSWRQLANEFEKEQRKLSVGEAPVAKVLSGEAGAAVTEHLEDVVEVVEAVRGNVKVLLVTVDERSVPVPSPSVPSDWSLASIILEGEGKFKLEEKNNSSLPPVKSSTLGGTFSTLVCSALLPLGYKVNPDLVVLRLVGSSAISSEDESFLVHQIRALANGRLILVIPTSGSPQKDELVRQLLIS